MLVKHFIPLCVGLTMLASACAPAAPSPTKAPASPPAGTSVAPAAKTGAPAKLKMGGIPALELMAPTYLAVEKGFFKEDNLEVGDIALGVGERVREALVAKEIDFLDTGILTALVGLEKGLPLKVVAGVLDTEIFGLWVRQDLQDKVKSAKDLKGLTVGVTSPGSAAWVALIYYLKKEGVGEKDVNILMMGSAAPAPWISALETKRIDAGILWAGVLPTIKQRGLAFPLIDISKPEVLRKYIGAKATSQVIVVRQDTIDSNPQLVQRRVDVNKKALQFVASHTSREVAEAAAPGLNMDVELATKVLDEVKAFFSPDGRISKGGVEAEIEMAYEAGILTKRLKYEDIVDTRFAGSAP